jgi:hypothetical protein
MGSFRRAPQLLAALLLLHASPSLGAAGFSLDATPSLGVTGEYDTNVTSRSGGGEEDYVLVFTPALSCDVTTLGSRLRLEASADGSLHRDHKELDRFGWNRGLSLRTIDPITVTPRLRLRPEGGVSYRDDTTRVSVGEGVGTTPAPETVAGRQKVRQGHARLGASWAVTPVDNGDLSGYWRQYRYPDLHPDRFGSTTIGGDGSFVHAFSPTFWGGPYVSAANGEYDNGVVSRSASAGLTATKRLSETTRLSGKGGYARLSNRGAPSSATAEGNLSLMRETPADTVRLEMHHNFDVGGGLGQATKRTGGSGGWERRFTLVHAGRLDFAYEHRTSAGGGGSVDSDVLLAAGSLRWMPRRYVTFLLGATATREWQGGSGGGDVHKEVISLGFTLHDTFRLL